MDINSILVFARVVENKSFTKAAMALGVEKSTISSKIANLESHLGVRLLNRNTRSVLPTEAGEIYYNHCRKILENAIEAEEFVKTFHDEPEGLLKIRAPKGLGRILLKDLFDSFMQRYTKIDLDVRHTQRRLDPVTNRIDVALVASDSPPEEEGMSVKPIMRFFWGFFASSDYIAKYGDILSVKQLEEHPIIHYLPPRNYADRLWLEKDGLKHLPKLKSRITVNEITPCVEALLMGLGVGALPTSSVRDEVKAGLLVQILKSYSMVSPTLYVVYPDRSWHSPKLLAFLDFIEKWGLVNTELPLQEKRTAFGEASR